MPVNPDTLEKFDNKQVILHVIDGDTLKELEGKVEAASAAGIAFKEKGKREVDLIEPVNVEEIALAPTKPKNLPQKKLKLVAENNARQHLLDRHGYDRSVVNGMEDDQAFAEHEDIDHSDLGHKHVEPDEDEGESGTDEE